MNNYVHMKLKRKTQKFTERMLIDINNRRQCRVSHNGPEALSSLSLSNLPYGMFTEIAMCLVINYPITIILDK